MHLKSMRREFLVAMLCLAACVSPIAAISAYAGEITEAGQRLAQKLDSFEVEKHWPAGVHINWETGDPTGKPEKTPGKHTHCSAFVASAAKQLGIYILRPPEHGQMLLANAQNEWLSSEGAANGWRHLNDGAAAQDAANHGILVVATYHITTTTSRVISQS